MSPVSRRAVTVLAAGLLPLVVTGCGAGLQAQTYQTRNVGDATNTAVGALALRNISLLPPSEGFSYDAGDDVRGVLTIVNDGGEDDRLTSISSPAADSVEVLLGTSAEVVDDLEVPALSSTGDRFTLRVSGLNRPLRAGEFVEMTFRFEQNGEVTALVPVAVPEDERERESSEHFFHHDAEDGVVFGDPGGRTPPDVVGE